MSSRQITTSAALYFDRAQFQAVPIGWFERVRELFVEHDLAPILFTAGGGDFEVDNCYVLSDDLAIQLWGEDLPARANELINALHAGTICSLGLDSPRCGAVNRDDSYLRTRIGATFGLFYCGMDEDLVSSPAGLLRRAYAILDGLVSIGYGYAYSRPLDQRPESYASGHRASSFSEALYVLRHRDEVARRPKTADELWSEELTGQKRHLHGLFRDAYPASLLSKAHIDAARLSTSGIGTLSEVSQTLWQWELTDEEVPVAHRMLMGAGLLIASAR